MQSAEEMYEKLWEKNRIFDKTENRYVGREDFETEILPEHHDETKRTIRLSQNRPNMGMLIAPPFSLEDATSIMRELWKQYKETRLHMMGGVSTSKGTFLPYALPYCSNTPFEDDTYLYTSLDSIGRKLGTKRQFDFFLITLDYFTHENELVDGLIFTLLAKKIDPNLRIITVGRMTPSDAQRALHWGATGSVGWGKEDQYSLGAYDAKRVAQVVEKAINGNQRSKLYAFVAPSGSGKSTIIEQLKCNGFLYIPKSTTRPRRENERQGFDIDSIAMDEFIYLKKEGQMIYPHIFDGHHYGLKRENVESALNSGHPVVCDTAMMLTAHDLKLMYPGRVEAVMIEQRPNMAGLGLEQRLRSVGNPSQPFASFQEELAFSEAGDTTLKSTKRRLEGITREARTMQQNMPYADFVLRGGDPTRNTNIFLDHVLFGEDNNPIIFNPAADL
jgi:guanylate kinase